MRPLEPERRVGRAAANYDRHMVAALAIVSPLILAGVLTASAVAKLRTPDDLAGWAELGVPAALRREWLRRLHPWAEIALGAAIALVGGVIGLVSGLIAVALMIAYTWLVVGARRNGVAATCACFGRRRAVTRVTIARNLWLTLLAIATAATSWTTPLVGGPAAAGIADPGSLLALVLASATTALILWPEGEREDSPATTVWPGDGLDYVRLRTPSVPVTLADGRIANLRSLASRRPQLILSVSPTCASCQPVVDKVPEWRELLPEVDIRFLLATSPGDSPLIETEEPQSLHDSDGYARQSLDATATPAAVLLGADGLLAGGPVAGSEHIEGFVSDILEVLHSGNRA